jgi:hypothetical protein
MLFTEERGANQVDLEYGIKMRKYVVICLVTFGLLISNNSAIGQTNYLPDVNAGWLANLNYYRTAAGLNPVTEDKQLSAAVKKHLTYLVMSDPKYFTGAFLNSHNENPASPYYTVQGAKSENELTSSISGSESAAIDSWMQGPFHAIGLLQQGLKTVGFDKELNSRTGLYEFGLNIYGNLSGTRSKVITDPGKGSYSRMDTFQGENPDSRQACGLNWKKYVGLPIWVSLLKAPSSHLNAQLILPTGKILKSANDLCIVDEKNFVTSDQIYGATGRAIISREHLVLIIPRKILAPGLLRASLLSSGRLVTSWSFTTIGTPAAIIWDSTLTGIKWASPTAQSNNPILSYQVQIGDSLLKNIQLFSTTSTSYETTSLVPGQYFICVRAIGKYRSGTCSSYSSYTVSALLK